jgi:hypothetical protein
MIAHKAFIKFYHLLYILITGMLLVWPAWYNRYPLVYFDSGAYMEMAVNMDPSFHRAFGYPLLIKYTGWLISNWPIIVLQGIVLSWLLFKIVERFIKPNNKYQVHFTSLVLLAFFSPLSWYAAQLMPDIWTLIMILAVTLLMFSERGGRISLFIYGCIAFIAALTHLSHVPLLLLLLILFFALRWVTSFRTILSVKRLVALGCIVVFSATAYATFNAFHGLGFRMSLASNVFITANLGEMGILKLYLDENCPSEHLGLCDLRENLPKETYGYLWDPQGPVQQHPQGWAGANLEYEQIVNDFLTQPRYLKWFLFAAVKSTIKQMAQIELGSGIQYAYGEGSPPYWPMKTHFKQELLPYLTSVQNKGDELPIVFFRWMNYISIMLSILILGNAVISRQMDPLVAVLLLSFVAAYFFNAAITGVLANVYERLQSRILPLIQFLAILVFYISRNQHATEE